MRIVYHPNSATISDYALNQWLSATIAAIDNPPSPGVVLDLGNPDYPWNFEPEYLADDRQTLDGESYSVVHSTRMAGMLSFSAVHSSEIPGWRAWYAATIGFRKKFVMQLPDMSVLRAVAPAKKFPLSLVKLEEWEGSLNVVGWV